MIRNLNQVTFQSFGTVLSEKEQAVRRSNYHTVPLLAGTASMYQTTAELWLNYESGVTILSASVDNEHFVDFYLDKPVSIRAGVWIVLTAFQGGSSVQMSGVSLPRLVQTGAAKESFVISNTIKIKNLYTFFYHEKEQGFLFPGESHSMLELTYVDQGSIHSVADGQDLVLNQGDMALYGPDQWHMQYADIDMAPRFITVSFDAEGIDLSGLINRKFQSPQKAIGLLKQMLAEKDHMDENSADMILALLTQLLITLQRSGSAQEKKLQTSHSINSENDIIRRAQQYISTHVREKLSVPLVADSVDVSPSYMTALFHKHLQISPGEYIRRIKLQESKQMIRDGNMNLTQIANVLQYSTIHHFSRQFKEKFGITPSEYARSVR